jgi:hypothetical protein
LINSCRFNQVLRNRQIKEIYLSKSLKFIDSIETTLSEIKMQEKVLLTITDFKKDPEPGITIRVKTQIKTISIYKVCMPCITLK